VSDSLKVMPNFIILGAMKSGTTSLHYYLSKHPEIFMSTPKETNFFAEEFNWSKGLNWYRSCFAGYKGQKAVGETSPNYTKHPLFKGIPQRIFSVLGPVKFIYVVRDPVERLITHYMHSLWDGEDPGSLSEIVRKVNGSKYGYTGKYYEQIHRYLDYFPRENFFIVDHHELLNDRRKTLSRLFSFLEVDPDFYSPDFEAVLSPSRLYVRRNFFGKLWLPASEKLWSFADPRAGKPKTDRFFVKTIPRPRLSSAEKRQLVDFFYDDVEKLRKFSGMSFAAWTAFQEHSGRAAEPARVDRVHAPSIPGAE